MVSLLAERDDFMFIMRPLEEGFEPPGRSVCSGSRRSWCEFKESSASVFKKWVPAADASLFN